MCVFLLLILLVFREISMKKSRPIRPIQQTSLRLMFLYYPHHMVFHGLAPIFGQIYMFLDKTLLFYDPAKGCIRYVLSSHVVSPLKLHEKFPWKAKISNCVFT